MLLLAALPVAALAATDLWVAPPGLGAPFTDVQAAVDAALPGDRVFVTAGDWGAVVLTKPIQLSGAGSDVTRLVAQAGEIPLDIVGTPAGGLFRVSGFELALAPGVDAAPEAFVRVKDQPGVTELHELSISRAEHDAHPEGGAYFLIEHCGQVYTSTLRMVAQPGPAGSDLGAEPLVGLRAVQAYVTVSDSRLAATGAPTDAGALAVPGGNGIELANAQLWMALTDVRAGERGGPTGPAPSGDALVASASSVVLHGGKTNLLRGGDAALDGPLGELLAGRALVVDGASSLVYAADVVLTPGSGPAGTSPALDAAPGALVVAKPDRLPSQWVVTPIGPLGQFGTVFLEGDPGAIHFWWLVLHTRPPVPLGGIVGPLVMDTNIIVHHPAVFLNVDGLGTQQAWVPADPAFHGLMVAYQSIEFDGGPFLQFAPPWFVTLELY